MSQKIFYLTTEISPFAKTSFLADFSAKVPLLLQEMKHDIRTMTPKYGFVSERKYILREVIRLRSIPFDFGDEEEIASAKSAFIPKTRVQVYFLEHSKWFKPLPNLLYKSKNGRIMPDNDIRYTFFCKSALAMLPHLFWTPDIIIGNDWQSALVPIIYNQLYKGESFYQNIKNVIIVHSVNENAMFSTSALEMAGLQIPDGIKPGQVNAYTLAAAYSDKVIVLNNKGSNLHKKFLNIDGVKKYEDKILQIPFNEESADFQFITETINSELEKLSV